MLGPTEEMESTFRYILIAARRAEQLVDGARARMASRHVKPTTIALSELDAGLVPWRKVTPEEYELLRQEEMAAREREDHAPAFMAPPRPTLVVADEGEVEEALDELEDDLEDELEAPTLEGEEFAEAEIEVPGEDIPETAE